MRGFQEKIQTAESFTEGGRCCFHMSSCPEGLTADNEVPGCVETSNFCSFSEARCVSPTSEPDGCDGTNTGTENVYWPVSPVPGPVPGPQGGRCCFHMSSCPEGLTPDN